MSGKPELAGQTVVVIGGSSGIGLETARRAREEGATVILTARDPDRLQRVGRELAASIAAFDATDFRRLGSFFDELPTAIDHVLVKCLGYPSHGPDHRDQGPRTRRSSADSRRGGYTVKPTP
jgi:NAD(P)-dependent dehydrogenase (short-subunit alcohol dehydrogenase family)